MENNNANEKKVLLSVQDLFVKFRVRGYLRQYAEYPLIFTKMSPLP